MDNKILLQELVKSGALSEELSQKMLQEAAVSKKPVEDLIYERRLVDEATVAAAKGRVLNIPFKKINPEEIKPELFKSIPEEVVRNYQVIPVSQSADMLVIGMLNPDNVKAQEAVKFVAKQLRMNLGVYLITKSDWEAVLRKYSPYQTEVGAAVSSIKSTKMLGASQRIIQLEEGSTVAEEAPIIRIVASTLKEAVWQKASDIHIEPQRNRSRIRFRINGELKEVTSFPIELHQPIVSRIKVLSNLKIDETRMPQDGRFRTIIFDRDIDFRVATFPTPVGEKVAVRVLDPTVGLKGLGDLGLVGRNYETLTEAIEKPYGMVLITGPTGSGKTTTLYAIMQILNKEDINIVSLEDPVEYFMDGLNQSQVRPEIGYDFASGLRQILRQDPDVIMVGEIRDEETAGLAVHAALTGHIVLSTLHTNNAIGVIPRLIDMKVEPFLLPAALNLMVAQRLIPRLCDSCKKPETAADPIQEIIEKELSRLPTPVLEELKQKIPDLKEPYRVYHSAGCNDCNGKGIKGRIALYEILKMTPDLEAIINAGPSEAKILDESRKQGMVTLREDGIMKALEGLISIEAVLRDTKEM